MVEKNTTPSVMPNPSVVDCACLIHGDAYAWSYVDNLHYMLTRHITAEVRLHVFTEAHRTVPAPYIKHSLLDWGIGGPKKAWWYKIQMFNCEYHQGPLLYFDLDTVIVDNLDWLWQLPTTHLWTVRDFKYLWRPTAYNVNSSVMWWNTPDFDWVWTNFKTLDLSRTIGRFHGDQDYITATVPATQRRFFDVEKIKSWRWQCLDGGYNFSNKKHLLPNTGTMIDRPTSILIFHGQPKPHTTTDPVISQHWK